MEQGYLFKQSNVQDSACINLSVGHYSYGHPKRIISYKLFRKAKSYGVRIDYQDGSYDIFEKFIS
jgi:hypothetical protein